MGNTWCNAEAAVVGIVRVLEELRARKPDATIVVNGLLPRTFDPDGYIMRGTPRTKGRGGPSLWDDILRVNKELLRYAMAHKRVHYFESEAFLIDKNAPKDELRINMKLMPDRLHPNADGYDAWATEIVQKLETLIK
mmetsp:Transcript_33172/g.76469  ORF Transcript_33172/g.76469 Transcript_33172/m.76469 type:complete len:137 (-) Transcript_33172:25-435(-)